MIRLVGEMPLDFTAYYDDEDFIGFTIVYPRKQFNWYWYFAVRDELRGKGYGQKILTQLIEKGGLTTSKKDIRDGIGQL